MAKYLSHVTDDWTTVKNLLKKDLRLCFQEHNHTLLESEKELEDFKDMLLQSVEQLNKKHPRCKPVKAWDSVNQIAMYGIAIMNFYKVKDT